jgi:hypothetical protein
LRERYHLAFFLLMGDCDGWQLKGWVKPDA